MIGILSLISCMGNDEPKFETYNGQKIKYLFGFAYVGSLADQEFVVRAGETIDMEFGVRDPNGDDFSMWFPSAPKGLDFPNDQTKGSWTVPVEYHQEFATFQVLAVDIHGAGSTLFLNYFMDNVEITDGTTALLSGWINMVTKDVRLRLQYEDCEYRAGNWEEGEIIPLHIEEIETCNNCDLSYQIDGFIMGEQNSGENDVDMYCRNLFDLESFRIAYASSWDEGYNDTMLLYRDPIWTPQGTATRTPTELSFTLELYTEENLFPDSGMFGSSW